MHRVGVVAIAIASLVVATASTATAGSNSGAFDDPSSGTVTAFASDPGASPASSGPAGRSSGGTSPCRYGSLAGTNLAGPDGSSSGHWIYLTTGPADCPGNVALGVNGVAAPIWVPATPPASPAPAPQSLAAQAIAQAQIPLPDVRTWPPTGSGEVNFPTWVHVNTWSPVSTTASAGGITVTVTATPTRTVVTSMDSDDAGSTYHQIDKTCPGPGAAYDPGRPYADQHTDCSLTWAWPSARYGAGADYGTYPLTVTVVYDVTWSGPGSGGTLPAISRSTTSRYPVREIEAVGS